MPEVPDPPSDDVEGSQLSELLGASHEEFLKAVRALSQSSLPIIQARQVDVLSLPSLSWVDWSCH